MAAPLLVALGLSGCGAPIASAPATKGAPAAPAGGGPQAPSPTEPLPAPEPIELSFSKPLTGITTMEQALERVKGALDAQGFGIITEIDVQAVMKKKLGVEMRPYWILGACNPKKALQAIEGDPQMGLLLPCKVVVYERPDGSYVVAFARPRAIFSLIGRSELSSLADDVETAMRSAFDAL